MAYLQATGTGLGRVIYHEKDNPSPDATLLKTSPPRREGETQNASSQAPISRKEYNHIASV